MSDPIDDKALEEYLQRGSAVSREYRALDESDMPADLDDRILARADEALRSAHRQTFRAWRRWSVPVALAATSVLVMSIVIESGVQQEVVSTEDFASKQLPRPAPEMPRSIEQPRTQAVPVNPTFAPPSAEADRAREPNAEGIADSDARVRRELRLEIPPAPPAAPAENAESQASAKAATARSQRAAPAVPRETQKRTVREALPQLEEQVASESHHETEIAGSADSVATHETATVTTDRQGGMEYRRIAEEPEHWLERIRRLRQDERSAEADREWTRFREAFPTYIVSETDSARPTP